MKKFKRVVPEEMDYEYERIRIFNVINECKMPTTLLINCLEESIDDLKKVLKNE